MMRSNSGGRSGLTRKGGVGARFKMASWITAVVAPANACLPVAISYSTDPKLNTSVRESISSPRACSGDI